MSRFSVESKGVILLLAVTAAAYSALALAGFVWDDIPLVLQNEHTDGSIGQFFLTDLWAGTGHESGYYRPLMLVSLAVDRALWADSGSGHHLHSLAWHLLAVLALWRLLRELVEPIPALLGAAVFSLHPLQSEAVAWIASRNDPMSAALMLGGVLLLLPEDVGRTRLGLGGALVFAALLSKESAILAVFLLLGLDWLRWGRPVNRARYVVLALAVGAWWGLRAMAGIRVRDLPSSEGVQLFLERGHEVVGLLGKLLIWPWPLSTGRTLDYLDEPWTTLVIGWAVLILGGFILVRAAGRIGVLGLAFFWLALLPPFLALLGKGQMGERYLYLPMTGLALAVAGAIPSRRASLGWAAPLIVGALLVLSARLPDWQNGLSLWEAAARDTPSGFTYAGYGHELNRLAGTHGSLAESDDTELDEERRASHRLQQVDLGQKAGIMFARALEAQPPFYDVCTQAMLAPLRVGAAELALEHARMSQERGCEPNPERRGIYASILAQNGLWDEARAVLSRMVDVDPHGRAQLVEVALGLVDGDEGALQRLRLESGVEVESLDDQLRQLLDRGGQIQVRIPEARVE